MKSILFLLFFISFASYSQIDYNKSISIPSLNAPTNTPIPTKETDLDNIYIPAFGDTKSKSDKWRIDAPEGVTFGKQGEAFADPSEKYTKKMNKQTGDDSSVALKGNQYFGDFKNNGKFVNIKFRDFGLEDGDKIKISINDVVVYASITLTNNFNVLDLQLKPGFNKVDFEALNQGFSGPNTAEFHVFDDKGKLIVANQWNLATGFKATVIIVKEKSLEDENPEADKDK
jgi:hypothetical protein